MDYDRALSLFKHDKTMQLLRADHFPLLVSFFHLTFKEQEEIVYAQTDIQSLLGDFLFGLQSRGVDEYPKKPLEYLTGWAQKGYLRRYYEKDDEPLYELSPATENALKWLGDLHKQEFVGTHSRLLYFFSLLKKMAEFNSSPEQRIQQLEQQRAQIDEEIEQIRQGVQVKATDTQLKEQYMLAEETARNLIGDFRQIEENFRELDSKTRQIIIKSSQSKGDLLDSVFEQQDFLWNTDQGKSFQAFWEFLMSESMQTEFDSLLHQINEVSVIQDIKKEVVIDRIKTNLVEAGDKVNRSNDGLIGQLRKFVEQKNLAESRQILRSIEKIEHLLMSNRETLDPQNACLNIDTLFRPAFVMDRPLFNPPLKVAFESRSIEEGVSKSGADKMFEQFYINSEVLKGQIRLLLASKTQVSLQDVFVKFPPTKGIAELIGYLQIATQNKKHLVDRDQEQVYEVTHQLENKTYRLKAPMVIFNR